MKKKVLKATNSGKLRGLKCKAMIIDDVGVFHTKELPMEHLGYLDKRGYLHEDTAVGFLIDFPQEL